jgi:EAL and modified HD-GYP domain-containing signal transduction protein
VGRQGIYDAHRLVGYELLFRSVRLAGPARVTGDQMTAAVLFGALAIGLDELAGNQPVFCNASRGVFTGAIPMLLPPERTVIEIVGDLPIDERVHDGARSLVDAGYRLALDNFVWGSGHEALLPLATFVKVDLMMAGTRELAEVVERCRAVADVRMVAERVERWEDVPQLSALGFELYQGYALETPSTVPGRTLTPSEPTRVREAADVLDADADLDKLEEILRRDPALAHHALQLASLRPFGTPAVPVSTIRDALTVTGATQMRNWIAVLQARPADAPADAHDAVAHVLLRARACELVAEREFGPQAGALAFTAGLISALDGVLDVPVADLVGRLAVSDELADAALGGNTAIGRLVRDAADYRFTTSVRPVEPDGPDTRSGVTREDLDAAFTSAFRWAMDPAAAPV